VDNYDIGGGEFDLEDHDEQYQPKDLCKAPKSVLESRRRIEDLQELRRLRELIEDWGGGTASGRPVKAVQVGGPLGAYLPAEKLDTPMDYEAFIGIDAMIGHGGIVVFDDTTNMAQMARFAMEFCAIESCGKCTPCRIGSTRGVEVIDKMIAGDRKDENYDLLVDLCDTMEGASLCAMGGMTPYPVRSVLKYFADDFASSNELT